MRVKSNLKRDVQHTPEPWDYRPHDETVYGPGNWPIAEVTSATEGDREWEAEVEANGRLIEASPALLRTARRLLEVINTSGVERSPVEAYAIANLRAAVKYALEGE